MKVAIVGSRKRSFINKIKINEKTKKEVEDLVDWLQDYDVVVSGGCKGVDSWAISRAIRRGLVTEIHFPDIKKGMSYGEMVDEYYKRNRKVVDASDIVFAFPINENEGGTGQTIEYAREKGKQVILK
jgi:hypothetical protein